MAIRGLMVRAALGALAVLLVVVPCANAASSTFRGMSDDGARIFFTTAEQLRPADTDSAVDVYERSGGTTARVSASQAAGNGGSNANFAGASEDGSIVFFVTSEQMVAADTDSMQDIYQRSGGATTLISAGQNNGNGPYSALFGGSSADGSRVFFDSNEQLVSGDTDSRVDAYERSAGATTQISTGPAGANGPFDSNFYDASADGSHVIFVTAEPVVGTDTDTQDDIFDRSGGTTAQVSIGPAGGNGAFVPAYDAVSSDGAHIFFETVEPLVAGDTNNASDVYERSGGATTWVSTGAANGAFLTGISGDGTRAFFSSDTALSPADTDGGFDDVYRRSGGVSTLVSTGSVNENGPFGASFQGSSADGSGVLFSTREPLTADDTDTSDDVYERSGGTTFRVSTGPAGGNGPFGVDEAQPAADGTAVLFVTDEKLTAADADGAQDVYVRSGGSTTLASVGTAGGNGATDAFGFGLSADGAHAVFFTDEALVAGDVDTDSDVYEHTAGRTRLVATAKDAPPAPTVTGTSANPANDNSPELRGFAEAGATVEIYAAASCSSALRASGSSAQFSGAGITVPVPDNSTTRLYALAVDANGYESPCSATSASFAEDSTAPPAPISLSVDPSPSRIDFPSVHGSAEAGTAVRVFASAGCSGSPVGFGAAAELAVPGISVEVPENAVSTLSAVAVDAAGNTSVCSAPVTYTEDSKAPPAKIHKRPKSTVIARGSRAKVTFKFGSESDATLRCRIDGKPFGKCKGAKSYNLAPGKHAFRLAATDPAGNQSKYTLFKFRVSRKR